MNLYLTAPSLERATQGTAGETLVTPPDGR